MTIFESFNVESVHSVRTLAVFKILNNLYSSALKFLFIQTHATSYSFYSVLLYTVKEKGGKPD
jgi:hypothetical protein